jgi:hypothetical protein
VRESQEAYFFFCGQSYFFRSFSFLDLFSEYIVHQVGSCMSGTVDEAVNCVEQEFLKFFIVELKSVVILNIINHF